jgi:CHRD domain
LAFALLEIGSAFAETVKFTANMNGSEEVPPADSSATGKAFFKLDTTTRELIWVISYHDLSSDLTGAHFHGPAAPRETQVLYSILGASSKEALPL